ncbi:MAG: T9SS type A sorting domain-containing protein [Bacteroidales bacterium]|nr:T9SS type A sorting domain-containing protein [Bacteroidales bacterium]
MKQKQRFLFRGISFIQRGLIAFCLLSYGAAIHAQEVVTTAGSYGETTSGSLSWTVGEPVIETITDGTNTLTQGFQQSKLTVTSVYELPGLDFTILVYPNPTSDFLTVKVEKNDRLTGLKYHLYDINGKLLLLKQIEGNETTISLKHLKPSTYFLKVYHTGRNGRTVVTKDNKEIKTFIIIKK